MGGGAGVRMAEKQQKSAAKTLAKKTATKGSKKRPSREEHARQKKEVTTKLLNLSTAAKNEIVEEVLTKEAITKQFGGFTDFLREQSVIGIGIGLVFGTQTKTVVDSIMKSLINPLTSLVLPGQEALTEKSFTLSFHGRNAEIVWGAIVYNIFSFIMVAIVVYSIYRLFRLEKLAKKKDK
jgi:large-conductance mechanosensitive channel